MVAFILPLQCAQRHKILGVWSCVRQLSVEFFKASLFEVLQKQRIVCLAVKLARDQLPFVENILREAADNPHEVIFLGCLHIEFDHDAVVAGRAEGIVYTCQTQHQYLLFCEVVICIVQTVLEKASCRKLLSEVLKFARSITRLS
jgi:hypothetical protein